MSIAFGQANKQFVLPIDNKRIVFQTPPNMRLFVEQEVMLNIIYPDPSRRPKQVLFFADSSINWMTVDLQPTQADLSNLLLASSTIIREFDRRFPNTEAKQIKHSLVEIAGRMWMRIDFSYGSDPEGMANVVMLVTALNRRKLEVSFLSIGDTLERFLKEANKIVPTVRIAG